MSSLPSCVVTVFLICLQQLCAPVNCIRIERSRYHDINIQINTEIPDDECQRILINLEQTLSDASDILYNALNGRASFGTFNIFLPETWDDTCVPTSTTTAEQQLPTIASTGGDSDITIDKTHYVYGNEIWTQQYGNCGTPGLQIYIPYKALSANPAKDFMRNWAKYRYGIFDEIGYRNDPIYMPCYYQNNSQHLTSCSNEPVINEDIICASLSTNMDDYKYSLPKSAHSSLMFSPHIDSITMFCDQTNHNRYAPTKHNLLCGRKPTLDIVLKHYDFVTTKKEGVSHRHIISNKPQFQYRRRYLTRYVLIIDDTPDILVRDSWSFLRSAIRKWIVYDLQPNTEVGIVLTSAGHLSKRFLEIKTLTNSSNRDLIASFVPYGPSDSNQHVSCLHCAMGQALNMLEQRSRIYGNAAHVILTIAPGIESQPTELRNAGDVHFATINYPNIRHGGYPLDTLAKANGGESYSVFESKFNSERSFLQTYFELSTILTQIGQKYYEGSRRMLPIEIHRQQIQDDETNNALPRARHVYRGSFYMDTNMGQPAGFYVYSYATESPLIHTMRLTSPMGQIFDTRSDQRMSVRQLSLSVKLNETGRWSYEIERFHGNPQPHIVQVLATPANSGAYISMEAWATRHGEGAVIIIMLYCKLMHGAYPIMDADVRVSVTKRTEQNYCVIKEQKCYEEYQLYDTGTGIPDIMRGDGIYTRIIRVYTPAVYVFEIKAKSKQGQTYTASDYTRHVGFSHYTCCGSEMAMLLRQEHEKVLAAASSNNNNRPQRQYTNLTMPFERYAAPITYSIDVNEFEEPESLSTNNLSLNFNAGTAITGYGYITDLSLKHLPDGKLRLYWTAPDLGGGQEVVRYELKYGFHLHEMIDFYDSASVLWSHETPMPLITVEDQPPAQQQFIIDPTLEPLLLKQSVYFGLRAFTSLTKEAKPGPVSNIVGTFIEIPEAETTTLNAVLGQIPYDTVVNKMNKTLDNSTTNDATLTAVKSSSTSFVGLLLPLVVALTSFIVAAVVLYVLCSCPRRKRKSSERGKSSTSSAHISAPLATADVQTSTNECVSSTYLQHKNYEDTTDTPDHHTVGIPIYQQSNDDDVGYKKRLSYGSSKLQNGNELLDYAINDTGGVGSQQHNVNKHFLSGLSIISMQADFMRRNPQQPLKSANFDSWSQSALLMRDNDQQHSPFAETLINQVNLGHYTPCITGEEQSSLQDMPPEVPPLPSTTLPEFYRRQASPQCGDWGMPKYTTIQNDNGNIFNSSDSNNKRLRNVTMV